jgi:hypothetical protein
MYGQSRHRRTVTSERRIDLRAHLIFVGTENPDEQRLKFDIFIHDSPICFKFSQMFPNLVHLKSATYMLSVAREGSNPTPSAILANVLCSENSSLTSLRFARNLVVIPPQRYRSGELPGSPAS